jgi:hypothetical protein
MWKVNCLALLLVVTSSCSYSLTSLKNPWEKDGIKTVSVPVFKNQTMEGGAEVDFSNSLRLYLTSRSGKLKYVTGSADARIEGEVQKITLNPASIQFGTEQTEIQGGLPKDRLLAVSYTLYATVRLTMIRNKDQKVLWSSSFTQSKNMKSGSYTDQRRTSNIFIKESAKRETIRELADTMMLLAVDSLLTEY